MKVGIIGAGRIGKVHAKNISTVSYTHLDVYKRQPLMFRETA